MEQSALKSMLRVLREIRTLSADVLEGKPMSGKRVAVSGRGGEIETWVHGMPEAGQTGLRPLVVELHGGGFALGDARKTDALRTWIAESYDAVVAGVNYRLAPEFPYPAALEDVQDALAYFAANSARYGIDPSRMYLFGYSAGANLSVAASMAAPEDAAYRIAGCALHYPFFDAAMNPAEVPVRPIDLSPDIMEAFNDFYLGDVDPREPLVSAVFAADDLLRRLPYLALYPVQGDVLADGAETLARRLRELGKPCELHIVEGAYHGYIEDEANRQVYEALTFPEQIEARPKGLNAVAERMVRESLSALLGDPCKAVAFPGGAEETR